MKMGILSSICLVYLLYLLFISPFIQDSLYYYYWLLSFMLGLFQFYYLWFMYLFFINMSLGLLVSIKMFLDISIIIGNVIDMYVFGLIAMCMNGYMYAYYYGLLCFSFMWYFSVLGIDYFLLLLSLIEFSAHMFQSLTLSNSMSINIVAGCLLSCLVGLISSFHFSLFMFYWFLFSFESINLFFQSIMFSFLCLVLLCF